jgi:hypothetical protein
MAFAVYKTSQQLTMKHKFICHMKESLNLKRTEFGELLTKTFIRTNRSCEESDS